MGRLSNKQDVAIEEILPSCPDIKFDHFNVPRNFWGEHDVLLLVEQGVERGEEQGRKKYLLSIEDKLTPSLFQDLLAQLGLGSTTSASTTSAESRATASLGTELAVAGNENVRNQRLKIWLQSQLEIHLPNHVLITDRKSDIRFSNSRDDFCFFIKTNETSIEGASISHETEPAKIWEQCEVFGVDADSKEGAKEVDKYQMLANMNKCAGDIAYSAVSNGILFDKITVYGMLVDYSSEKTTKAYKLSLDFKIGKSSLHRCDDVDLSIPEAFSRVTSILKKAMVPYS